MNSINALSSMHTFISQCYERAMTFPKLLNVKEISMHNFFLDKKFLHFNGIALQLTDDPNSNKGIVGYITNVSLQRNEYSTTLDLTVEIMER